MLKIENIDKILAINSQDIEIDTLNIETDYYEFKFTHDNIYSAIFKVQMRRRPQWQGGNTYIMELWDGISSTPLSYQYTLDSVKDPFALLKYLADVIYDWDIITNK
jgi:hypothetical protein